MNTRQETAADDAANEETNPAGDEETGLDDPVTDPTEAVRAVVGLEWVTGKIETVRQTSRYPEKREAVLRQLRQRKDTLQQTLDTISGAVLDEIHQVRTVMQKQPGAEAAADALAGRLSRQPDREARLQVIEAIDQWEQEIGVTPSLQR
jgi:hypothetical protein